MFFQDVLEFFTKILARLNLIKAFLLKVAMYTSASYKSILEWLVGLFVKFGKNRIQSIYWFPLVPYETAIDIL